MQPISALALGSQCPEVHIFKIRSLGHLNMFLITPSHYTMQVKEMVNDMGSCMTACQLITQSPPTLGCADEAHSDPGVILRYGRH